MLEILRRIIEEVNSAENLQDALKIIVARISDAIKVSSCTIYLIDHQRRCFTLSAAVGPYEKLVDRATIPLEKGIVSLVVERGEPINLQDARQHERYTPILVDGIERDHGYLGVPIQQQQRMVGVLVVRQEEKARFDESIEAFLITISSQLAGVIAQAEASGKINKLFSVQRSREGALLKGLTSVPGVGIGHAVVVFPPADLDAVPDRKIEAEEVEAELTQFREALQMARDEMRVLAERLGPSLPAAEKALFDAYLKLLDSHTLINDIEQAIQSGMWAQGALKRTIRQHILKFRRMENEYLRERASDLEDLGRRILCHLQGESQEKVDYPRKTILVGEEVSASDLAEVPSGQLCAVVSMRGSANSHVAILARALGIPMVMGVQDLPVAQLEDRPVIVDGYCHEVYVAPKKSLLKEYKKLEIQEQELNQELEELRQQPAETQDHYRISLHVNTGLMADVSRCLTVGAEGVGLFRTEVPFMVRDSFPTIDEQRIIYKQLLSAFAPLPVTMRVLDVGGDKQLPYFPIDDENPFLGWRGIRILLDHPEIFRSQIRAMVRASAGYNNLQVMLPMVGDVAQVEQSIDLIDQVCKDASQESDSVIRPKIGIMVEIPSAVYQARALAKRVDFLSVGSNDLTQYTLAVDRNNSRVASLYDSLHPAVLYLLQEAVKSAHSEGKPISICGEMAGDPVSVVLLLAMGFDTLSMSASALPRIKWVIRNFKMSHAKALLKDVWAMPAGGAIRQYLTAALDDAGLGGLIRAGRN
ncbi:MAG: phosphoenolpyruvate--protein phosphotransferase [Gammaproteobacteria bacterium]|nr:phosphoenolpyruvate--protein phosphotransferase [Gammaproteobacteria bacterium]